MGVLQATAPAARSRARHRGLRARVAPLGWVLLLALPLVVTAWGLDDLPLYTKGEAREAAQVWAEVHGGGWILPLRNGVELPSKPPLFHWLAGAASLVRGRVDELAMRLPSVLLAILVVFAVVRTGARRWGLAAGIVAGVVLATSFEWVRAARGARVDMALAACLTSAFLCLDAVLATPVVPRLALAGFWASAGLATLAKGPVGLVLPVLVLLVHLALRRDLGRIRRLRPLLGGAVALAIPAAWYLAAIASGGEAFVGKQILKENVFRFLGAGEMRASHAHPFWYQGPAFLAGFLPWSVLLVPVAAWVIRERRRLDEDGRLFLVVWAVVVFAFYSIPSSKRSVYLLPAYPAAALLFAAWWRDLGKRPAALGPGWRRVLGLGAVGLGALAVAVILALVLPGVPDAAQWTAALGLPRAVGDVAEGVPARAGLALALSASLLASALVVQRTTAEPSWRSGFAAVAVWAACATALVVGVLEPALAAGTTMRPFMAKVGATVPASAPLYFFGGHPDYEVVFYANRRLPTLKRRDLERVATAEPDARLLLFERRWKTLDPALRGRIVPLGRSAEVRDDDRGRLLLARLGPAAGVAARTTGDVEATLDLRFAGSSTLHGFEGTAPSVRVPLAQAADGTWTAVVDVPVAGLRTGNARRDANMRALLRADAHPVLRGVVEAVRPETVERTARLPLALTIAGATRQVDARVRHWTAAPDEVSFDAGFDVSLAAFGLEAPSALLLVRVADQVHVDVHVRVRRV